MRIPLIYHLIELYLKIDTILLLHIDDKVDAGDEHEREEDAEDDVEVKVEDAGTAGREKE
jgi:hypothetical protein